jgi:hypothetical protein
VPTWRTIARIEEVLAEAGVQGIQKEFDGGRLSALSFVVLLPNSHPVKIRLPADTKAVYQTMASAVKKPHRGTLERIKEQADRTAWKLMQDWVEVQISLIQMQKIDFLQVFLPYVWDGERTFYTALKDSGYKNLLPEHT